MAKGMNVEVGKAQAEVLDNQAEKIKNVKVRIDGLIQELQSHWWGADAKKFANQWEGTHSQQLVKVHKQLKNVAQQIRTEAKDQLAKSAN
jgi:uncharacterized protein YukE